MNCKPGDLAVIVRAKANPEYLGRIVRVIELYDADSWQTEPLPVDPDGFVWSSIMDRALRPIRPDAGDDATLMWAGKPEQVTA